MILETKYASGKNTVRYKKNTGYSNHRELFDDLKDFQQQRDDNNDYSLQVVSPPAGYNLVFEDTFSGNSLDLNKWKMGLPFGSFYTDPDEHGFYFPEDGKLDPNTKVVSVNGGRLNLDCTWYPKTYNVDHLTGIDQERKQELLSNCNPNIAQVYKKSQYDGFTINYGGGAVHSTDSWHYGSQSKATKSTTLLYFEIEILFWFFHGDTEYTEVLALYVIPNLCSEHSEQH